MITAPILAFPTENDPFILDCDASLMAEGAVLSQIQNGQEKVIGYYSRCFTRTERKYCVTRRELLAVVDSMKHFHHYIYGRKITVRSDHSSLKWLLSFRNVEGQLARWLMSLSAYDFEIIHRSGRLHSNADALSRRPCAEKHCKYCENVESKENGMIARVQIQSNECSDNEVENGTEEVEHCSLGFHGGTPSTDFMHSLIGLIGFLACYLSPEVIFGLVVLLVAVLILLVISASATRDKKELNHEVLTRVMQDNRSAGQDLMRKENTRTNVENGDSSRMDQGQVTKRVVSDVPSENRNLDSERLRRDEILLSFGDEGSSHVITGVKLDDSSIGRNMSQDNTADSEQTELKRVIDTELETEVRAGSEENSDTSREMVDSVDGSGEIDEVEFARMQDQDENLRYIKEMISGGVRPDWQEIAKQAPEIKYYWARIDSMVIRDDKLYRKWESDDGKSCKLLLVIPKSHREVVLKQLHDNKSAGHLGVKKTLHKVRERFFWFKLRKDVELWIKRCDMCNSRRGGAKKAKAPLQQYNVGAPNERIAIDFMGPFVKTTNGNRYMMVVGDLFTKWTECYCLENLEAITVARVLVDRYIAHWGVPLICHTDQGKQFESKLFQEMCSLLEIDKTRTSSFFPQSNGFIEKHNHTIIKMLTSYVGNDQKDWDEHVPLVMMAYRSAVQESSGFTPNLLHIGHEVRLPVDVLFGKPVVEKEDGLRYESEYVVELEKKMDKVHSLARKHLTLASENMKTSYNTRLNFCSYKVGEAVWYYYPQRKKGLSPKLQRPWIGPCKVVTKINDVLYRIKVTAQAKPKIVHHNKLKKYNGSKKPFWEK